MNAGDKVRTITAIRSQRTGIMLPREGTFVTSRENIGRTLILVDFGEVGREYLLPHEIEPQKGNQDQQVEIKKGDQIWSTKSFS